MLVCHFIGIIPEFVEIIFAHLIITDIDARVELWKVNIDPIRVGRLYLKKTGIPDDPSIDRIFKRIGVIRVSEQLVLMRRKRNPEITFWSWSIIAITSL